MFNGLNKLLGLNKKTEEVVEEQQEVILEKSKEPTMSSTDFANILKDRIFNECGRRLDLLSSEGDSTVHASFTYNFVPANLCLINSNSVELFGTKLTIIESQTLPLNAASLELAVEQFKAKVEGIKAQVN